MGLDGDTCIETTSYHPESRTLWIVRYDGQIVKVGETRDDHAGARAFEQAAVWARAHYPEASFVWKHHHVKTTATLRDPDQALARGAHALRRSV